MLHEDEFQPKTPRRHHRVKSRALLNLKSNLNILNLQCLYFDPFNLKNFDPSNIYTLTFETIDWLLTTLFLTLFIPNNPSNYQTRWMPDSTIKM